MISLLFVFGMIFAIVSLPINLLWILKNKPFEIKIRVVLAAITCFFSSVIGEAIYLYNRHTVDQTGNKVLNFMHQTLNGFTINEIADYILIFILVFVFTSILIKFTSTKAS